MAIRSDVQRGQTKNPILAQFWIRNGLWEMCGLRLEDLHDLPWQEGQDLIACVQAHAHARREDAQRAQARASAPMPSRAMGWHG